MKILHINTVYAQGSTGKIARDIHDLCVADGIECKAACRETSQNTSQDPDVWEISGHWDSRIHGVLAKYTMFKGCFSYWKTRAFLKKVDAFGPDVIHLHNLHGSYVHIGLLMEYIKQKQIPVVFTLHDCWAFTAICSHFIIAGCDRWQHGCGACPQKRQCSAALVDMTAQMWQKKKAWFTGVNHMTVVIPSDWLGQLVQKSFLKTYPVKVLHNGIDLSVFRPTPSDFRAQHGLENKKIVLGVAFGWGYSKGLDVMVALAKRLPPDYQVVMVGTNAYIDKQLPASILSIHRTQDQQELAGIYTAADVFVNPTREETYPTVNMEAIACGTPVITFRTGGSPEIVDETSGIVVAKEDVVAMEAEILRICQDHPYTVERCLSRAKQFDKNDRLREYIDLYRSIRK